MDNYGIYIDFHGFFNESEEMEEVCWGMTREEAETTIERINRTGNNIYPYVVLTF